MTDREISYIQFVSLYKSGMNDVEIGKALGFTRYKVGAFRKKLEFPPNAARKYFFTEEMDKRIREMHEDECTIQEIATELEMPYQTVRNHCVQLGIDTGKWHYQGRGQGYVQRVEGVLRYLKEHGPTWRTKIMEDLGIPGSFFSKFSRDCFDEVEYFRLKRGKGKRVRKVHEIYGELTMRPFLALRNDPRVIDFVASRIAMKIKCGRDAAVLSNNLNNHLGKERTREVVGRLYAYPDRPPKRSKTGQHGNRKYSDEEYLLVYYDGLNDTEAADVLGVSIASTQQRRKKLGLPTQGQRKRLKELLGGD